MFAVETIHTIDQVAQAEWDSLSQARPFVDHRWLRLTEAVLDDYKPRYVLLRDQGRLVGGAVCSLQHYLDHRLIQSTIGWLLRRSPYLSCYVPISFSPGLLWAPESDLDEILERLIGAIQDLSASQHAPFSNINYLAKGHAAWPILNQRGYHRVMMLADTYLEIHWTSFKAYLSDLPRKKRKEIRRIERRAKREGTSIDVQRPSPQSSSGLYRLMVNVVQRHDQPVLYKAQVLTKAADLLGDDLTLIVSRQDDQITGCVSLLRNGDHVIAKWLGLDYDRTWDTGTYHRLVSECVRQAIVLGARRLIMGGMGYETKRHFGVTRQERFGGLNVRGRALNWLVGRMLSLTGELIEG